MFLSKRCRYAIGPKLFDYTFRGCEDSGQAQQANCEIRIVTGVRDTLKHDYLLKREYLLMEIMPDFVYIRIKLGSVSILTDQFTAELAALHPAAEIQ